MSSLPDPHGQAALMLCEALALLLIEEGVLERERVVEAVDGVVEVKQELAGTVEPPSVSAAAVGLLRDVGRSIALAAAPGSLPGG